MIGEYLVTGLRMGPASERGLMKDLVKNENTRDIC